MKIDEASARDALTAEHISSAYRAMLGRNPESESVIDQHMTKFSSLEAFLRAMVESPEYQRKSPKYTKMVHEIYHQAHYPIDTLVSLQAEQAIFNRVTEQWKALGNNDPYWSVLSMDEFRMGKFEKNKKEFYRSGVDQYNFIEMFCARNAVDRPKTRCMELGCGVGRVTRYIADNFDSVVGFDVSEPNIQLAKQYLQSENVENVELRLLRRLDDIEQVGSYSFFFSIIVLQHNPPPLIRSLLNVALRKLERGGVFLFQVPTHMLRYEFDAETYLKSPDPRGTGFEMHSIPMHAVLDVLADNGCRPKEILADNFAGLPGSHTFFGIKET